MKKRNLILIIIVAILIAVGIILAFIFNNKEENKVDNSDQTINNTQINSEYNEKCTKDAQKILDTFSVVVNKELNTPIKIKYDTSFKNEDKKLYCVRFIVGKEEESSSDYFTVTIEYNEDNNYENILLLAVAEPNTSISKKTQDQMLLVWKCFLNCKVINISEKDRNEILNNLFNDENKILTDNADLKYEKKLNGHKYTMEVYLDSDYNEEEKVYIKNKNIRMVDYSIEYLY